MRFEEKLTSRCREINKKEIVPSYVYDKITLFLVRWSNFSNHEHGYANNNEGGSLGWRIIPNIPKSLICYETSFLVSSKICLSVWLCKSPLIMRILWWIISEGMLWTYPPSPVNLDRVLRRLRLGYIWRCRKPNDSRIGSVPLDNGDIWIGPSRYCDFK
jgi:hypothetical protein